MDFERLSTLLWRERELLDLLLFKAEEKQYVIVTGKTRWLGRIAREIELILTQLRALEVERVTETEALADHLGLAANPSLLSVAQAAPTPWRALLHEHHEGLLALITEIRSMSAANRGLVETGLDALNEALLHNQTPSAGTYTATGRATTDTHRAVTLDGTL